MKLVKAKRMTVRRSEKTENRRILEEFIKQNEEVMEVTDYRTATAWSCTGSLKNSIARYRMAGITAITENGKVYLIKVKD